jgi:hypothetical protein
LVFINPGQNPRFKTRVIKYILIMERVKQLETYQLRVGTPWFYYGEITLPAFKLESKYNRVKRNSC